VVLAGVMELGLHAEREPQLGQSFLVGRHRDAQIRRDPERRDVAVGGGWPGGRQRRKYDQSSHDAETRRDLRSQIDLLAYSE
jgi:hypothetical protein